MTWRPTPEQVKELADAVDKRRRTKKTIEEIYAEWKSTGKVSPNDLMLVLLFIYVIYREKSGGPNFPENPEITFRAELFHMIVGHVIGKATWASVRNAVNKDRADHDRKAVQSQADELFASGRAKTKSHAARIIVKERGGNFDTIRRAIKK